MSTFFAGGAALGNSAGAELERTTQRPPSAVHSIDMPPKLSGATASSAERPTPKSFHAACAASCRTRIHFQSILAIPDHCTHRS